MSTRALDIKYEVFPSIEAYINANEKPITGEHYPARTKSSAKSGSKDWNGTETYAEAVALLRDGWDEILDRLSEAVKKAEKVNRATMTNRAQAERHVVGAIPHVPAYCAGSPRNMIRFVSTPIDQKAIHILYDTSASCSVSTEQMITSGVKVIEVVNTLERMGYRVRLDVVGSFTEKGAVRAAGFTVKDYKQPLHLRKLAFPIAHPANFRRMSFAWLERAQLPTEFYAYGYPMDKFDRKEEAIAQLAGDGVVYLNIELTSKAKDYEELMVQQGILSTKASAN